MLTDIAIIESLWPYSSVDVRVNIGFLKRIVYVCGT